MIAAYGMYDRAETALAHDRMWASAHDHLSAQGVSAPQNLTRGDLAYGAGWQSPDLLVSQTCGLPFRSFLKDRVTLVGTPDYGVVGCPPGFYRSVILVRRNDPRQFLRDFGGACFAVNDRHSQSGWAAAAKAFATASVVPGSCLVTGAHRVSAQTVAEGAADICAVDAVTWRGIQRWDAMGQDLRVLLETPPTPGLPLITAMGRDPAPLFSAMQAAIAALSSTDAEILGLRNLVRVPLHSYYEQPLPPSLDQFFGNSLQSFVT